jgi:putative ABC transport system permease protein
MQWRRRRERELDEEIAAHLAMAARDLGSQAAARKEFGSEALVKEVTRSTWRFGWLDRLRQDARYGMRSIRRAPGYAAVVVLTLALGIGVNTAMFSIMRAALSPVAIPAPERAVAVWTGSLARGWHQFPVSVPDYMDWRASGIFDSLAALDQADANLRMGGRTERVSGVRATPELFAVTGMATRLGRVFGVEDMAPGSPRVAVLSDGLWRKRFGAAESIVGQNIVLDGVPHTVIGVLPRSFPTVGKDPLYVPLLFEEPAKSDRGSRHFDVAGRLSDGISLAAAQKRMDDLAARLEKQEPLTNTGIRVEMQPFVEAYRQETRDMGTVLAGAVGFVLLIACANIAGLVLARGAARAREMTIRAALGASRWQLSRQLLIECVLLALVGGAAAILPAWGAMRLVAAFPIDELPNVDQAALDWSVLAFNLTLALVTGIVLGLIPAWQARGVNVAGALQAVSRSVSGGPRQRLRGAMVAAEIALTMVLLVGAGLMLRTLVRLRASYPGYQTANLLTMNVALSENQYAAAWQRTAFHTRLLDEARTLAGVHAIGAIDELPGSDNIHGTGLHFPDRPEPRPEEIPIVLWSSTTSDYFRTMQIPLVRGRFFGDADREGAPPVAIIDEWMAKKYWPNEDAVGKSFSMGRKDPPIRIVGVVGNVDAGMVVTLLKGRIGQLYVPMAQRPKPGFALVVRTEGDQARVGSAIEALVRRLDPDQAAYDVMSMNAVRAAASGPQQLASLLLGGFAAVALLLAAIGIYGVVAFNVGRRTREFGIRMSLGARPADVLRLVMRGGGRLTAIGIAIGLAGAVSLTHVLDSMLYGIQATDPVTIGAVVVLVGGVALAASLIPARRATRVNPVLALREE